MNIPRRQVTHIRRGILLARHDDAVARLKIKHEDRPTDITATLLDVYADAEKILLDAGPLTKLTMKAYRRTYDALTTKGQQHDISNSKRRPVRPRK